MNDSNGEFYLPPQQINAVPAYPQKKEKGDGIAFGIASMVLGMLSVLLFCTCINVVLSVLSIIFGIVQLVKNKNKVFAIVGMILSTLAIILTVLFWVLFSVNVINDNDEGWYNGNGVYTPYNSYDYYDLFEDID